MYSKVIDNKSVFHDRYVIDACRGLRISFFIINIQKDEFTELSVYLSAWIQQGECRCHLGICKVLIVIK